MPKSASTVFFLESFSKIADLHSLEIRKSQKCVVRANESAVMEYAMANGYKKYADDGLGRSMKNRRHTRYTLFVLNYS